MKNNREDKIKEAANNLLKMFETGQMPEAITRTVIQRKEGDWQPSFDWSIGNQILMYAQGTMDARGFHQWKKVNRSVKKGSNAIHILAPLTKTIIEKDEETGEEIKKTYIYGFRYIPVFRYEDTEGEELVKPDYKPMELPPLWEVAQKLNLKIEYSPFYGDCYGSYNLKNMIKLHTYDFKTFYHELAHAVHGSIKKLKGGQHAEQEVVAETVAAVLLQIQGIEGYEYHSYNYIKHYTEDMNEKDVVKAIMKVLGEVEEVLNIILQVAEEIEKDVAI